MQKPITLARQEFVEKIVSEVNKSELPLIIIEPVIKNLLDEIQKCIRNQAEAERIEYDKYLAEQSEKNKKTEESERMEG